MKFLSRLTPGLCIRWIIATAKVAVLFGLLLFLLSFCSCSSSRPVMTETAATESITSLETAKDSVGSSLEIQTSASGYLDISDLQIIFYPPADIRSPVLSLDSVTDDPPAVQTPKKPQILYPALLNIGRLSTGSSANTELKESSDSVGSSTSDLKHDESTTDSEKRIQDPTKPSWPVMLTLFMALLIIIYTGFMIYRSNRL